MVDEEEAETVELEVDDYEEDPVEEAEQPETDDQEIEEVELTDDLEVEVMVNGEAKQASLGELKRLKGSGAALTHARSQNSEKKQKQT